MTQSDPALAVDEGERTPIERSADIVQVALDLPLDQWFDYLNRGATQADIGRRVEVPFGRARTTGIIAGLSATSALDPAQLKPIGAIDREVEPIPPDVRAMLEFASGYYQYPFCAALFAALPPAGRLGAERTQPASAWRLTEAGRQRQAEPSTPRAPAQQWLLDRLANTDAADWLTLLAERSAARTGPSEAAPGAHDHTPQLRALLRKMLQQGWIEAAPVVAQHGASPAATAATAAADLPLTEGQTAALAALRGSLDRFDVHLLFGVTGSGKTTVYARMMRDVVAQHRQVLMLVPEINLTPQLDAVLRSELGGASLVVLHSGLPAAERRRRWQAAATGAADVVVGTRLAAFAPLPRLGLIVVDEEHDSSFKQEEGLRYHARDVSVWRARARGVPILLGSATPVLESLHNAQSGRYRLLQLPQRPIGPMPSIELIDLRRLPKNAAHNPEPSGPLLEALSGQLARGEQSLVLINRRGYAPVLRCNSCGWVAGCSRCSARLVLHQRSRLLRCHHCGLAERPPQHCPACGNSDLSTLGAGTERLEETLARLLPGARMLRVDRDTVRSSGAWARARDQIRAGEIDLLVGTQMLAKGHDFPRLTLVGVVEADQTLYSSDFRAPERLFALLTQVAGRAGRADLAGRVLIETAIPQHPLFAALAQHDYAAFAGQLLEERRRLGLPPFAAQAILRADAVDLADALEFLTDAARAAQAIDAGITRYDPVPALLMRRAGRERAQLLVQSASRGRLQRFLATWRSGLAAQRQSRVHWVLDVDPLEL
jgi:primosomal protein N' (replication factor Y) (superfamily II helicase)